MTARDRDPDMLGFRQDGMMQYLSGDLFASPAQTLVNTVNTVGVMGKGIAAQFKTQFPQMFERYREHCDAGLLAVGKLSLYRTENKWVLNFPTKKHWRSKSKLEWIEAGLDKLVKTYTDQGIMSLAMPQLGCGNGGLDWESEVRPLMAKYLSLLNIPVHIYVRDTDTAFIPEHTRASVDLSENHRPRRAIGFEEFMIDVHSVARVSMSIAMKSCLSAEGRGEWSFPSLPDVELKIRGTKVTSPGDDFLRFWEKFTNKGALTVEKIAARLAVDPKGLHEFLLEMDYIRDARIYSESSGGITRALGVMYSPPADEEVLTGLAAPN